MFVPSQSDSEAIIAAVESEDEVGTVLRLHMVLEVLLTSYLDLRRTGEIGKYAKEPREFAGKLSLAVAFGLPVALARPAHQVNVVRNKVAHRISTPLGADDVEELKRQVNLLSEISPDFIAVERRTLELPQKAPGVTTLYGRAGPRVDFVLSYMAYYAVFVQWLSAVAPENESTPLNAA